MSLILLPLNAAKDGVLVEQKFGTSFVIEDGGNSVTVDDGGGSLTVDDGGVALQVDIDDSTPIDVNVETIKDPVVLDNTNLTDADDPLEVKMDNVTTANTLDLLSEILIQLKIMNTYNNIGYNENIKESDLEE